MNGFIRQSIRNAERTAINDRARGRGGNVRDVTNAATDLVKVFFTGNNVIRDWATRRRLCGSHEISEWANIGAVRLRVGHRIVFGSESNKHTTRGIFHWKQITGDADFVEVGIG